MVEGFEGALRQGLRERLGHEVGIWQDVRRLRLGQNWQTEIEDTIGAAAAFVAILSPGYLNSDWCRRQRRCFLEKPGPADADADRTRRFLKIVKAPADEKQHLALLPQIQHVAFFRDGDERTGAIEFVPGTDEFRVCMRETVHAVAALLRTMRRSREPVFVATPADDALSEWEQLRAELQAQSFDVRPEGPLDASFADDLVKREVERGILAVFLLTGTYEPFVERQLQLARDSGKRLVCWVRPAAAPPTRGSSGSSTRIRRGDEFSQPCTLLERHSSRDLIREVLEALKPRPATTAARAAANGAPRVYLLYDPTTERDSQLATTVRRSIELEQLEVAMPLAGAASDRLARHRELLRGCDGVLLCRGAAPAPDQWLFQTVPDVLFAEQQLSRPPLVSKGLLLADPASFQGLPNVSVMPLTDTVTAAELKPFLEPLRRARHA